MVQISVIIPVENSIDNIDATLLSVFAQSMQDTEIIIVDNASVDGTSELLKRYVLFDKRVQVIGLKQKTTRNDCCRIGIEKAHAPYIYLMDGTKYVYLAQGCLDRLLMNIQKFDSDFVYSPCLVVDAENWSFLPLYQVKPENFVHKKIFNSQDIPSDLLFRLYLSPWAKLYKKEFLLQGSFEPYEETFFLDCLLRAKKITYDLLNLYFYHMKPHELKRNNAVQEELANYEVLQKHGMFEKYKNAYIYHKMRNLWLNVMYAEDSEKIGSFEEMKAEFSNEDFSQYDFDILRKRDLFWAIRNIKNLRYEEFKAMYLGSAA